MIKKTILPFAAAAMLLASCNNDAKIGNITLNTQSDSVSYVIGNQIGSSFKQSGLVELNHVVLDKAIKQALQGNDSQIDKAQVNPLMKAYFEKAQKVAKEKAEAENKLDSKKNKAEGEKFLAENKLKEGIQTTESGLQYKVIKEGTGEKPLATDRVKVTYKGTLLDGTVFDSNSDGFEFMLNGVIKGWTEGVQLMTIGSKYKFFIPSELAYGENQMGATIKANSTLIFEVELLDIIKAEEASIK
ncbi:MAG: FKBP-type peptidyl-prolyl cis-trans isomerase [Marinifilaceae bacterium]